MKLKCQEENVWLNCALILELNYEHFIFINHWRCKKAVIKNSHPILWCASSRAIHRCTVNQNISVACFEVHMQNLLDIYVGSRVCILVVLTSKHHNMHAVSMQYVCRENYKYSAISI